MIKIKRSTLEACNEFQKAKCTYAYIDIGKSEAPDALSTCPNMRGGKKNVE